MIQAFMAVVLSLNLSRHPAKEGIYHGWEKFAVCQLDILQKLIKSLLRNFRRRFVRACLPRITPDRIPVFRRLKGIWRVAGIHFLPRPERPAEVVRFKVIS